MEWQKLGPEVPKSGNRFTGILGRSLLKLMGWRLEGEFPNRSKMIVAVAPHTSNIDFLLAVGVIWGLRLRASFLAKHSLFRFPLGVFMSAMGGIPVDRSAPQGLVGQIVDQFTERSHLVLGITPEGTRSKVRQYKSGFALIAQSAGVPVLPAIIHANTKVVRFEPLITDVADPERVVDMLRTIAASAQSEPRSGNC